MFHFPFGLLMHDDNEDQVDHCETNHSNDIIGAADGEIDDFSLRQKG